MAIKGVSHIAVGVRDIPRAVGFYRDIVGLNIIVEREEEFTLGDRGTRKVAFLRWAEGPHETFIIFDQWPLQSQVDRGAPNLFQIGLTHFSLWVTDLEAIAARARKAGCKFILEPETSDTILYGEAPGKRVQSTMFYDPEGNIVQLDQRL